MHNVAGSAFLRNALMRPSSSCGVMTPNVPVERHVAALSRPKLIYLDSSILPDLARSYAACPLQRKLGTHQPEFPRFH
jgi:hypothetical protein